MQLPALTAIARVRATDCKLTTEGPKNVVEASLNLAEDGKLGTRSKSFFPRATSEGFLFSTYSAGVEMFAREKSGELRRLPPYRV